MREKKIIFLTAFLHSGLDWVHSLLDSHPQLLITPALSFYRCWTRFDFNEIEKGQKIYTKFYEYISENIGASKGLGYYIGANSATDNINMFLGIFFLSVIGYVLIRTLEVLYDKYCFWAK